MSKPLNSEDKNNIQKWITYLIHKIEQDKLNQEQILTELKELKKYFFTK